MALRPARQPDLGVGIAGERSPAAGLLPARSPHAARDAERLPAPERAPGPGRWRGRRGPARLLVELRRSGSPGAPGGAPADLAVERRGGGEPRGAGAAVGRLRAGGRVPEVRLERGRSPGLGLRDAGGGGLRGGQPVHVGLERRSRGAPGARGRCGQRAALRPAHGVHRARGRGRGDGLLLARQPTGRPARLRGGRRPRRAGGRLGAEVRHGGSSGLGELDLRGRLDVGDGLRRVPPPRRLRALRADPQGRRARGADGRARRPVRGAAVQRQAAARGGLRLVGGPGAGGLRLRRAVLPARAEPVDVGGCGDAGGRLGGERVRLCAAEPVEVSGSGWAGVDRSAACGPAGESLDAARSQDSPRAPWPVRATARVWTGSGPAT